MVLHTHAGLYVGHPIHEASRTHIQNVRIWEKPHNNPVIIQITTIRRSMHSTFINKHASLYQYIFRDKGVIQSTATRLNQATRFGLFQTIIRLNLFHSINKNVACSKVFTGFSPELSIKTLPAPRHVAGIVFVDNSGRAKARWRLGIIRKFLPGWMVLQYCVWLYYHKV